MNEKPPVVLPERNPQTHAAHRKEVWWQIFLPLILGCLLLSLAIAGVIWAAAGSDAQVTRWTDISLIWLILPALIFALLTLGVLVGITYLVSKLLGVLPGYARLVQDSILAAGQKVMQATDALVAPTLKLKSWSAAAQRAFQSATAALKPSTRTHK